jgi:acetyltransferase-like isoleucine patch superfamily enzyme
MMISDTSKRVIPFRQHDAKRVGEGCFYLDFIVWLNGDRAELGDRVAFNYGCFVNSYGGLTVGDGATFGPYTMVHTANHKFEDTTRPIVDQGWESRPVEVGSGCWIGMGVVILPGVRIGEECVVGAGSVVTKDLEDYCVAVGAPAKPIKSRR